MSVATGGEVNGILVVDKPAGCTSHDVVQRLRKVTGRQKIGHSGTLDPAATGVLVVGLGKATRLFNFLTHLSKEYRATVKFGSTTRTLDAEGEVLSERPCSFDRAALDRAAEGFVGEIMQIPPMVSAVKVGGERLYKAARRGEEIEREPRPVRVYRLEIEEFDPAAFTAVATVQCSAGTYIRSLAADMGEKLGCGAHLQSLRRLAVGTFTEGMAVPLAALEEGGFDFVAQRMLPMRRAMKDFPMIFVDGEDLDAVSHGRSINPQVPIARPGELTVLSGKKQGDRPAHEVGMTSGVPVGIIDPQGELIAVYRRHRDGLKPAAVLI
ncbi:MAG: tRNA pseudouridine(55) synthase TruB [Actinomycetota bacterium]